MKTSTTLRSVQALVTAPSLRTALLGLLAVVGSTGAALAQHTEPAQPTSSVKAKQETESLWLTVDNPAQKQMRMQVVSLGTSNRIIDEVNRHPSYGCKLNFRNLPAGKYAVLVQVGGERYRYTVQVQTQTQTQTTISVPELTTSKTENAVASTIR